MPEQNSQRVLVRLLQEVAAENGVRLTAFSDDWLFCLQRDDAITYVLGYDFDLNSATAKLITKDKAATADLLAFHQVPHVPHRIFHSPQMADYVPLTGNWPEMTACFEAHGRDVVCKPNEGSGGAGVSRVRTQAQLEAAVLQLFRQHRSICLSPFQHFDAEYRVAVLSDACEFVYRKERPTVLGDGSRTVRELLAAWLLAQPQLPAAARLLAEGAGSEYELDDVPAMGSRVSVNWRHNLGQGATPKMLSGDDQKAALCALALRATRALGIELASVDVVDVAGDLRVLEINSGIMMESLARQTPELHAVAKRFYEKIIRLSLDRHAARKVLG